MKKISRATGLWIFLGVLVILFGTLVFIAAIPFPGDTVVDYSPTHAGVVAMSMISFALLLIIFIRELIIQFDDDAYNWPSIFGKRADDYLKNKAASPETSEKPSTFKLSKWFWWSMGLIILLIIYFSIKPFIGEMISMYNTSKNYQHAYTQKVQEKAGFYDKMWKTYLQKDKITNVNRETFILVTQIIMENRADGKNITWKWVQENQQTPYSEFTKFYADLSEFITSQREDYFQIEKACQVIAQQNNLLLDTFPNNFYNRMLKCPKIEFEYGMLSDSTRNIFKTKTENLN